MSELPAEINSATDSAWSSVRSYYATGNAWLMPVLLVVMLVLAAVGFVRKAIRRRKRDY